MAVENEFKESTVTTSNHTVNYDLPLWEGDDVTSWLTQVNDAMNKIDTGIYDAKQSSHEVVTIAENAQKLAEETKAESDASAKIVEGYEDRLKTVEDTTAEHTADLTNLSQRVDTQDAEIHSLKEVEKTILTDVGTLKNSVAQNTTDLETDKASIQNLQSGQESLTSDVEELQNEIVSVGRVMKLLGNASAPSSGGITSTDSTGSLTFSGLHAYIFGNGIVRVNIIGELHITRNNAGTTNTLIFDLVTLFAVIYNKMKELYENQNLQWSNPALKPFLVYCNNTSGGSGSIQATKGEFITQLGTDYKLYFTPSNMLTSNGTYVHGWQLGATYKTMIPDIDFIAYEGV